MLHILPGCSPGELVFISKIDESTFLFKPFLKQNNFCKNGHRTLRHKSATNPIGSCDRLHRISFLAKKNDAFIFSPYAKSENRLNRIFGDEARAASKVSYL